MKSNRFLLGMMQGRLCNKPNHPLQSFPWSEWREEFPRAAALGFNTIEWLLDGEVDRDNPIASAAGRKEISDLCERHNMRVASLCAHTFIDGALLDQGLRGQQAFDHFLRILDWTEEAHIDFVVLPAMEGMSLKTEFATDIFLKLFQDKLTGNGPIILLESDLQAEKLGYLINNLGDNRFGVLYDLGNATALHFDIQKELKLLDRFIHEIHIKDRKINNGPSLRLGQGDASFEDAARTLAALNWSGLAVLETPVFDDWRREAEHNIHYTKKWFTTIKEFA